MIWWKPSPHLGEANSVTSITVKAYWCWQSNKNRDDAIIIAQWWKFTGLRSCSPIASSYHGCINIFMLQKIQQYLP
jgi:hypothetical protein